MFEERVKGTNGVRIVSALFPWRGVGVWWNKRHGNLGVDKMKEQDGLQNLASKSFVTNVAASPRFRNSRTPQSLHDLGMTTHSGTHPQEPIQPSCFCLCFDFTLGRDQCAEAVQNYGSHLDPRALLNPACR